MTQWIQEGDRWWNRQQLERALDRLDAQELRAEKQQTPAMKYLPGDVIETSTGNRYLVLDLVANRPDQRKIASCQSGIVYDQTSLLPRVIYRAGKRFRG